MKTEHLGSGDAPRGRPQRVGRIQCEADRVQQQKENDELTHGSLNDLEVTDNWDAEVDSNRSCKNLGENSE